MSGDHRHEHYDGRRNQTLDRQAQDRVGHGHHPGQDHCIRGGSRLRFSALEIEAWVNDAKQGMENALRAKPLDIREQYEKQLKALQEAYGEAMLELRARKKLASLLGEDDR